MALVKTLQHAALSTGILSLILVLTAGQVSALTTAPSSPDAAEYKETSFTSLSLPHVLFTEHVLLDVPKRSRLECSKQCAQIEVCAMFTFYYYYYYHQSPGDYPQAKCRLFGKVHGLGDKWEKSPGAKSFGLAEEAACTFCPAGYGLQCGRCLTVVTAELIYTDAQRQCVAMDGGRLVMTKTLEDMDCIRNFTLDKGVDMPWMGADDMEVPGQFQWNDGTPLPDTSPLWASEAGDPAHYKPGSDCVYLSKSQRKLRTDTLSCRFKTFFACEHDCVMATYSGQT